MVASKTNSAYGDTQLSAHCRNSFSSQYRLKGEMCQKIATNMDAAITDYRNIVMLLLLLLGENALRTY